MADHLKRYRMAGVEELRIKAFALGGPLGNVLTRSFDLVNTVIRDGIADEKSGYAIESLSFERVLAKNRDEKSADPLRHLIYGLAESMASMLESIREGQRAAILQPSGSNDLRHTKDVENEGDIVILWAGKEQLGDSREQGPSVRPAEQSVSGADSDEDKSARKRRLSSTDEDDDNNSRASVTPRSRNQANSRLRRRRRPERSSSDKRRFTRNSGPRRYADDSEDDEEVGSWGRRPEAEIEGIPCKLCNNSTKAKLVHFFSTKAKLDHHMTSFHKKKTRSAYVKQTLNSDDDFIDDEDEEEDEEEEEEEGEDDEKKDEEEVDETSEDECPLPPRRSTRVIPKNMFDLS